MKLISLLLLTALWWTSDGIAIQVSSAPKTPEETIEIAAKTELELVRNNPRCFFTRIDLGDLKPGTEYRLKLLVLNPTSESVEFASTSTSCNCGGVSAGVNEFASNLPTPVLISFKTPPESIQGIFGIAVYFESAEKGVANPVELQLGARLAGNLALDRTSTVFRLADDGNATSTWRVKLAISEPISIVDLRIEKSDSLSDVVCEIKNDDIGTALFMTTTETMVDSTGIAGSVHVIDSKSGRKTSTDVTILKPVPVTITPSLLRFRKSDENREQQNAMALLQIPKMQRSSPASKNEQKESTDPVEPTPRPDVRIAATLEGKAVEIQAERMTDRIYRIHVTIPGSELRKSERKEVVWGIQVDSKSFELSTIFMHED